MILDLWILMLKNVGIYLKFSEHLSTEQIANILDMSIDQVEAYLNNSEENT